MKVEQVMSVLNALLSDMSSHTPKLSGLCESMSTQKGTVFQTVAENFLRFYEDMKETADRGEVLICERANALRNQRDARSNYDKFLEAGDQKKMGESLDVLAASRQKATDCEDQLKKLEAEILQIDGRYLAFKKKILAAAGDIDSQIAELKKRKDEVEKLRGSMQATLTWRNQLRESIQQGGSATIE